MSLSPSVHKTGEPLPPHAGSGVYGEAKVRVEKLLWSLPRGEQPSGVRVLGVWWGDDGVGAPVFNVAHTLQRTLSTTVTHAVAVRDEAFWKYLSDMAARGGGYSLLLMSPQPRKKRVSLASPSSPFEAVAAQYRHLPGTLLGVAQVDLTTLAHGKAVQGYFSAVDAAGAEVARLKLKAWASVGSKDLSGPAEDPPAQLRQAQQQPSPRESNGSRHGAAGRADAGEGAPSPPRPPRSAEPVAAAAAAAATEASPSARQQLPPPQASSSRQSLGADTASVTVPAVSSLASGRSRSEDTAAAAAALHGDGDGDGDGDALDSVYRRALQMKRQLQKTSQLTTVDSYEASLVNDAREEDRLRALQRGGDTGTGVGIGVGGGGGGAARLGDLPTPVYLPHLLGGDLSSGDEDDDLTADLDASYDAAAVPAQASFLDEDGDRSRAQARGRLLADDAAAAATRRQQQHDAAAAAAAAALQPQPAGAVSSLLTQAAHRPRVLVVYLGGVVVLRPADVQAGRTLKVRYLSSADVLFKGAGGSCATAFAGGDGLRAVSGMPWAGEALPLLPSGEAELRTPLRTCFETLRVEAASHVVLEFVLGNEGGYDTCLGIVDLPAAGFLPHPPTTLPRVVVTDPMTNTPALVVHAAAALLLTEEAPCRAPEPLPQPPQEAADAAPKQKEQDARDMRVWVEGSGNVDAHTHVRTQVHAVEVVHTYTGGVDAAAAPGAAAAAAAAATQRRITVTNVRCDGLPMVAEADSDAGGAEVAPSCCVAFGSAGDGAAASSVHEHTCEPEWGGEAFETVVEDGAVLATLYHVPHDGVPAVLATACAEVPFALPRPQAVCLPLHPPQEAYLQGDGTHPASIGTLSFTLTEAVSAAAPAVAYAAPPPPALHRPLAKQPQQQQRQPAQSSRVDDSIGLPALSLQLDSLTADLHRRLSALGGE